MAKKKCNDEKIFVAWTGLSRRKYVRACDKTEAKKKFLKHIGLEINDFSLRNASAHEIEILG